MGELRGKSHRERCPRDSDWCDGVICTERGIDCPNSDQRQEDNMDDQAMLHALRAIVTELEALKGECDRIGESITAVDLQAGDNDADATLFDSAGKELAAAKRELDNARSTLAQYVGARMLLGEPVR